MLYCFTVPHLVPIEDQRHHNDTAEYGLSSRLFYLVTNNSIRYCFTECMLSLFYTENKTKNKQTDDDTCTVHYDLASMRKCSLQCLYYTTLSKSPFV